MTEAIKVIGKQAYQIELSGLDFAIMRNATRKYNQWSVDVFDSSLASADSAYLKSDSFSSLADALAFVASERVLK